MKLDPFLEIENTALFRMKSTGLLTGPISAAI